MLSLATRLDLPWAQDRHPPWPHKVEAMETWLRQDRHENALITSSDARRNSTALAEAGNHRPRSSTFSRPFCRMVTSAAGASPAENSSDASASSTSNFVGDFARRCTGSWPASCPFRASPSRKIFSANPPFAHLPEGFRGGLGGPPANTLDLRGSGSNHLGGTRTVTTTGATGGQTWTTISTASFRASLLGGFLLVNPSGPTALLTAPTTGGTSRLIITISNQAAYASAKLCLRSFALDATKPAGVAMSNGIKVVVKA